MANMTISSLPQLSSHPHALMGGAALLTGSILLWVSLVWILVSIVRYFAARDKKIGVLSLKGR